MRNTKTPLPRTMPGQPNPAPSSKGSGAMRGGNWQRFRQGRQSLRTRFRPGRSGAGGGTSAPRLAVPEPESGAGARRIQCPFTMGICRSIRCAQSNTRHRQRDSSVSRGTLGFARLPIFWRGRKSRGYCTTALSNGKAIVHQRGAGCCIDPDSCVGRLGLGIVQGGLAACHDSPCGGLNGKLVYCHQNHQRPTVSLQSADMTRERQGTHRKPIFWP
jgi:hypothetical protein